MDLLNCATMINSRTYGEQEHPLIPSEDKVDAVHSVPSKVKETTLYSIGSRWSSMVWDSNKVTTIMGTVFPPGVLTPYVRLKKGLKKGVDHDILRNPSGKAAGGNLGKLGSG